VSGIIGNVGNRDGISNPVQIKGGREQTTVKFKIQNGRKAGPENLFSTARGEEEGTDTRPGSNPREIVRRRSQ